MEDAARSARLMWRLVEPVPPIAAAAAAALPFPNPIGVPVPVVAQGAVPGAAAGPG